MAKTTLASDETRAELLVRVRAERCRRSFMAFVQLLHPEWDLPWFQIRLIREIQAWADAREPYGLILSMPPGHGKSAVAKLAVAWLVARDPEQRVAYASYAQTLAEAQVGELFGTLDSEVYVEHFGRLLNQRRVVTDESKGAKRTQDFAELLGGSGFIKAIGRGGGLTGFRLDIGVVDDLVKDASEARSTSVLRECRDWFSRVLSTRKRPGRPLRLLVLATRWTIGDLSGWLMDEQPDRWVEVRFPALKESEPDERDPRQIGEALWSAVATADELAQIKALDPEGFRALYQQWPVAEGGNLFRADWLTRRWVRLPQADGLWVQSWDLRGGGAANKGSYAVGQLWFRPHGSSDLYLVDQVRGRWSPDETYEVIRKQQREPLWAQAQAKLIEAKADGVGALSLLAREIGGLIPVKPTADKESRARAATPYFAALNVVLPESAHWLPDYIAELLAFPASANDDQVDATSQALAYFAEHQASAPPRVLNVRSRTSVLDKL